MLRVISKCKAIIIMSTIILHSRYEYNNIIPTHAHTVYMKPLDRSFAIYSYDYSLFFLLARIGLRFSRQPDQR